MPKAKQSVKVAVDVMLTVEHYGDERILKSAVRDMVEKRLFDVKIGDRGTVAKVRVRSLDID